jgi:serine/threonine protein kinase
VTAALRIGRYEIEGELGAGGMATIYLALDPFMKRKVAVKVLPRQFTHDPQFRIRFQREAEVIAALEHPHIVAIYDIGEDDDQPYIVMRFMTGGTLLQRIKAKPLAVAELVPTANRIAEALDDAHAQNVVHRDLKPSNILFDGKGHAYLSDFGIAKVSEAAATFTGTGVIGTPEYMSPEQARGIKDLDGRSDVYSLGVVTFHALTGQLPYRADTPMGAAVAHITEPVPNILTVRPDLPPACDHIIRCAMAKNPDDRYPTAGELANDLAQLAAGKLDRKPYIVRARAITRSSAETEPAASQPPTTLTPETSKDVVVLHTLKGHMHHVVGVAFGPAGQLLASGSTDKTVRLWNPRLGQAVSTLQKHTDGVWSVAFSPDGSLLASGGRDALVVVWDVAAGVALRTLKHKGGVTSVAFNPDGSTIAVGCSDATVQLWNASTGESVRALRGHSTRVTSVTFSPDKQTLASGALDGTIRLWNATGVSGQLRPTLEGFTSYIWCVAFSPDGQWIASGTDKVLRLWDVNTGKLLRMFEGHASAVSSIAFSPDGRLLASGAGDQTVRLWNASTGEHVRVLEGHPAEVNGVAFSPDGHLLASGGADGVIRVWGLKGVSW